MDDDSEMSSKLTGLLSHTVLTYHVQNAISDYCTNFTGYCGRMKAFLGDNQNWIKDKLATVARDDVYWGAVSFIWTILLVVLLYSSTFAHSPFEVRIEKRRGR